MSEDPLSISMKQPDEDLKPFAGVKRFGCTFSTKELTRRGIDWQDAFEEMKSLNFNCIRIAAYWSDIEPDHGRFDFDGLDELLEMCQEVSFFMLVMLYL